MIKYSLVPKWGGRKERSGRERRDKHISNKPPMYTVPSYLALTLSEGLPTSSLLHMHSRVATGREVDGM